MNYGDYSYIEAFPQGGRRSMPPTGVGRRQQLFEVWIRPVPEGQGVFALRAAIRESDPARMGRRLERLAAHAEGEGCRLLPDGAAGHADWDM